MPAAYSDREVLEIFIETVEELKQSEFVKQIKKNGVRVEMLAGPGVYLSNRVGPDREAIKAFLLTLRFFRQNNDQTSLSNMATRVGALSVDQALKDEFTTSRDNFNAFLNAPLSVPVAGVGADTRDQLFESFLYGVFAHSTPKHRRNVKAWEAAPYYHELEAQFLVIAAHFMAAASAMAESCKV
jgi:hypothetical protein